MHNVTAIIVTYNVGNEYRDNLASILPQVGKVIIVDNSTEEHSREILTELQNENREKIEVLFNESNIGLASAQNLGVSQALKNNPEWLLFLDDDSQPKVDMVARLLAAYEKINEKEGVVILAPYLKETNANIEPRYVIKKWGMFFYRAKFGHREVMEVMTAISSGSMVKTSIIKKLGKFRDEFFIDYVDTEYCLRALANGYKIVVVRDAVLNHRLGKKRIHKIGNIEVVTSNHRPERRFTIFRNRIILWKEYALKTPVYILYDITAAIYDIFRIIFFEENKAEKLKQAAKGFVSGLVK